MSDIPLQLPALTGGALGWWLDQGSMIFIGEFVHWAVYGWVWLWEAEHSQSRWVIWDKAWKVLSASPDPPFIHCLPWWCHEALLLHHTPLPCRPALKPVDKDWNLCTLWDSTNLFFKLWVLDTMSQRHEKKLGHWKSFCSCFMRSILTLWTL